MTRYTRRIFFYSGIITFAILAPLLIAYSLGYTFRLATGEVEKTGGIFIKSKTPRLSVFLDGTFIKDTSYLSGDALLTNLAPGTHRLRLEKANHHPWSKTVIVEPFVVIDFRNILLVANPPFIATSTKEEVAVLQAADATFRPIAPQETVSVPNLSTSPSVPSFFISSKGELMGRTPTTTIRFISHINSFTIIRDMIYFIDRNGFLGKLDPTSKQIVTIGRPGFYLSDQQAQFSATPNGKIIILDASGGLFISDGSLSIQTITGGVRQFAFDSNGKKILIRKDQGVEIMWLDHNTFQPFEESGTREGVFMSSATIQDADWFFGDDAHIAIRTSDGILLTDIDSRDGKNVIELTDKKTDELVTLPDTPKSIFFRKGKIFYTISL